jgi:hypothetical protein
MAAITKTRPIAVAGRPRFAENLEIQRGKGVERAMAKFDRQHGVPGLREAQSDRLPASLYALLMRPEFCGIAALQ